MIPKERPILFSGPMVRAILDGHKTQTRRVVKGAWPEPGGYLQSEPMGEDGEWCFSCSKVPASFITDCPYGAPTDRLWVRETWDVFEIGRNGKGVMQFNVRCAAGDSVDVALDDDDALAQAYRFGGKKGWKPAIHMPRWASRITLEVTGVRVERLQEIIEADAKAEGVEVVQGGFFKNYGGGEVAGVCDARNSYMTLWDSLNAKRGFGWDKNPWVWVITFKTVLPL